MALPTAPGDEGSPLDGPAAARSTEAAAGPPDVYLTDSPVLIPYSAKTHIKYKGVTVDPRAPGSRWRARVSQRGHEKLLGPFNSAIFAARVYDAAALYLRGAAPSLLRFLNFPSQAYEVVAATDAPAMQYASNAMRSDRRFVVEADGDDAQDAAPPAKPESPAPAPAASGRPVRPSSKMIVYDFDEETGGEEEEDYVDAEAAYEPPQPYVPPSHSNSASRATSKRVDPLSAEGSGFRGVNYRPHRNQYESSISLHGARMFCGSFSTALDAARVRETRGFIAFGAAFREKCNFPEDADALCAILYERGLLNAGTDAAAGVPAVDVHSDGSYGGGGGGGGGSDGGHGMGTSAMHMITDDVNVWADVPDRGGLTPAEDSTMRYRGVIFRPKSGMYEVTMKHQGVKQYYGRYATAEEAARVYDEQLLSLRPSIAMRNANFPEEMRRKLAQVERAAAGGFAPEGEARRPEAVPSAGTKRMRSNEGAGDAAGRTDDRKRSVPAWPAHMKLHIAPTAAATPLSRARDEIGAAVASVGSATMQVEDALKSCTDPRMRVTLQSLHAAMCHACTRVAASFAVLAQVQLPADADVSEAQGEAVAAEPSASPPREDSAPAAAENAAPMAVEPAAVPDGAGTQLPEPPPTIADVAAAVDQCAAIADALMR